MNKPSIENLILHYSNEDEFNYSIHISNFHNFIYFDNPKAACSTTKGTLNRSVAKSLGLTLQLSSMADVHNRNANLLLRPSEFGYNRFVEALADPRVIKFSALREPIARIASAYANKLTSDTPHSRKIGKWLGENMGPDSRHPPTFARFIDLICDHEDVRNLDPHWRPQCRNICHDCIPDMWLARTENIHDDLQKIISFTLGAKFFDPFDARVAFPFNASNSGLYLEEMTQDQRNRLRMAYSDDFKLFKHAHERQGLFRIRG